jgi:DNA-directed RNA polymerase subunit L
MSKISELQEEDGIMTFTVSNLNVAYANAIRRTILSDIPIVVFKTSPYEQNKCNIQINTTRLNNEIIKQRLSCIPICIDDIDFPVKNYLLELDVENKTDTILYVTTKDFKIKNLTNSTYLDENEVKKIFPPFIPPTGKGEYYIDFVRLRPKLSDELPGERIKLNCEFTVGTARDDSMFNITGTCSYGCTVDQEKMLEQLEIRKQKWKDEGKSDKEITFEAANWKLLEGLRYVKSNSFDFILQSVGIYENSAILVKACNVLINKFQNLRTILENDDIDIKPSNSTLPNCYDVILENEDYTIGNILNNDIYRIFYNDLKVLDYVGFKKMHPHDSDSILRLSFIEPNKGVSDIKTILKHISEEAIETINKFKDHFKK